MCTQREDVDLTQTQVITSQHTRQKEALKDQGISARLTSLTDPSVVCEIRKEQTHIEIGRRPDCHIHVNDKRASGVHLRIFRDEKFRYFVEELGPNGCFVNKYFMKKGETRALQHGDEVSLCIYARSKAPEEKAFAAYLFTVVADGDLAQTLASGSKHELPSVGFELTTVEWVRANWDMRTVLGSGNFSEVRLGVDVRTGNQRAIKVIEKKAFQQFQRKRDTRLELKSEVETLISLDHPCIIKVFEWFETNTHLYLVMELVSDGDLLACILDGGPFNEYQARRLFRQLCEAVKYLHRRHIVHRDLKPENILVSGRDRNSMQLKLADFGLAWKNMKSGDCCVTFCGTPHYLSPEVINTFQERTSGQLAGYGKQVDMWSLGVILYVMLSSVPPFEDDGLYESIVDGRFEFDVKEWTAVSPEAKDLVKRLMTVSPADRITIQQALDHQWLTFSPPASPLRPRSQDTPQKHELRLVDRSPIPKRPRRAESMTTETASFPSLQSIAPMGA